MPDASTGKIDFHLHSYASNVTDYYAANALSLPESYSDPKKLYAMLKARGMTMVTLTDHNSIDGGDSAWDAMAVGCGARSEPAAIGFGASL